MFGKGFTSKTCGTCRYSIKRRTGSFNSGFGESSWMFCDGHRNDDITGRGLRFLGLVHKGMGCQLPNLGLEADWKPVVRASPGMRKARPYSAHPSVVGKLGTSNENYEREWHKEKMGLK